MASILLADLRTTTQMQKCRRTLIWILTAVTDITAGTGTVTPRSFNRNRPISVQTLRSVSNLTSRVQCQTDFAIRIPIAMRVPTTIQQSPFLFILRSSPQNSARGSQQNSAEFLRTNPSPNPSHGGMRLLGGIFSDKFMTKVSVNCYDS